MVISGAWTLGLPGIQPIEVAQVGAMVFVRYPYRKQRELLLAIKGRNVHCCICDQDIPKTKRVRQTNLARRVTGHIMRHDRRPTMRKAAPR